MNVPTYIKRQHEYLLVTHRHRANVIIFSFCQVDKNHPLQMLIANVDYDDFKGKMGIGRILNGELNAGDVVAYGKPGEPIKSAKIAEVYVFNNVGREKVETASAGDIVMITGISDVSIGDTVMSKETPIPLPPITVEEPTVRMSISVNKSPLAGREGKLLQSRVIRDRLFKELDRNVALKVINLNMQYTHINILVTIAKQCSTSRALPLPSYNMCCFSIPLFHTGV